MPLKKKLSLATGILGILTFVFFGLCCFGDAFAYIAIYCGASAFVCMILMFRVIEEKPLNFIPVGLGMMAFGMAFFRTSLPDAVVMSVLSLLYALAGVVFFVIGILDWCDRKKKSAPKEKKPLNKQVFIGLGLMVGGWATMIILFQVLEGLIVIGSVMANAGLIVFVRGLVKKAPQETKTVTPDSTSKVKMETCTRCACDIRGPVCKLDGAVYCADCKAAIEGGNRHAVCSVCSVDLPMEHMHVIDNVLLCHDCFLKQYANIDVYGSEAGMPADVDSLRKKIIAEIKKNPATKYQLASLLWQDAANCFGDPWDGAWFKLDLVTGKLSADVGTYPNQFGASRESSYSLTAARFHQIALQYNMSPELQSFQSEEDWQKLFDHGLKDAVSSARAALQKKEDQRKQEETEKHAIKIPAKYATQTPNWNITELKIEIHQHYSSRSVQVSRENGKYRIVYHSVSHMSPDRKQYSRTLSNGEAVWLEKQVESTIGNPDKTTWQSLPGGDRMSIVIKRSKGETIDLSGKPLRKYTDLKYELEYLAQYGSVIGDK